MSRLLAGALASCLSSATAFACADPMSTPGFVVSPAGDDSQDGTSDRPFRTLERARLAMRAGGPRTVYVDGGVYALTAPLRLEAGDDGTSFLNCPGQSPALDGGSAALASLIEIAGASGIVLRGLTFAHAAGPALVVRDGIGLRVERSLFAENGAGILLIGGSRNAVCANRILSSGASGIELKDGGDQTVIADNVIDGAGAPATHGGGIFVHGASGTLILRNRVQNTLGLGIGVLNWDGHTINRSTLIAGNVVRSANRGSEDSGAIYLLGRSHVDQQARIDGNLIEDAGTPGDAHTIAIYLDDSTSGVAVEHNVIRRPGTHAVQIHGGDDVSIQRNLIDLGDRATSAVLFQAAPADTHPTNTMQGNRVAQNVIMATTTAQEAYTFLDGGDPAIAGNLLVRPAGWAVGHAGGQSGAASDLTITIPPDGQPVDPASIIAAAAALIGFVPADPASFGPRLDASCPPPSDTVVSK